MYRHIAFFRFCIFLLIAGTCLADRLVLEEGKSSVESKAFWLPYAFSTQMQGTGAGAVFVESGKLQSQDTAALTAYYSDNHSLGIFGGISNLQVFSKRWFFTPIFGIQKNADQRFYGDFGFETGQPPSGSNASAKDDFVNGKGWDVLVDLGLRRLLDIGDGDGKPVHVYKTRGGLLVDGATNGVSWNPFKGGRTYFEIKPFYQLRSIEATPQNLAQLPPGTTVGQTIDEQDNGIEIALEYDNRDFPVNPSKGSLSRVGLTRNFGWFDTTESWTSIELDWRKHISFGDSKLFDQQVLALNVWTAYSPTWEVVQVSANEFTYRNRPPSNKGATLGGVKRQRGYTRARFSDKAAIFYAAEMRLMPNWNPFGNWPIIRKTPWRAWQLVGFGEIGRVAPDWDLSELHEDMRWSLGVGVRALIGGGLARFDIAVSEEDTLLWAMVGQAF